MRRRLGALWAIRLTDRRSGLREPAAPQLPAFVGPTGRWWRVPYELFTRTAKLESEIDSAFPPEDAATPAPRVTSGDTQLGTSPTSRTGLWKRWRPLLLKELRETLRDTRTIGTLFVMPLLVYPLLSLLMQNFVPRTSNVSAPTRFEIAFDSAETLERMQPLLNAADRSLRQEAHWLHRDRGEQNGENQGDAADGGREKSGDLPPPAQLRAPTAALATDPLRPVEPEALDLAQHHWQYFDKPAPNEELVQSGVVDLILVSIPDAENPAGLTIELIYDPSRDYSRRAAHFVALRIERYNLMHLHTIAARAKLPTPDMVSRLETPVEPVASALVSFATIVPLILIMMTITGAVYPAIDLTAGERERGTLESLMAAPLPRVAILGAKYVAVWVVAMLTASLNVASMLLTLWVLQLDAVFLGERGITLAIIVQIFLLLALFALFFSAILLVVTSLARSFKEAQAYLIPLMMLSLTPGALALMPELRSELWLSLVPMVNLVVLSRDVMLGNASVDFAWLAVVSTLLYAASALGIAAQVFGSDAVLYGSQGSWRELLQSRPQQPVPTPAFSLLLLALLFPAQFILLGIMGRMQGWTDALTMIVTMSSFTAVLFFVLPLSALIARGYQIGPSFSLQRPSFQHALAGVLLGMGLWPMVGASLWALGQLRAWLMGSEAGNWSDQVVQLAYQQLSGWAEIPLWVLVFALAIVPAVCEEFFFRGVLLQSLRQKNSDWFAIVASGMAFGLFHFIVESSVAPLRFVVTASLGAVLAWVCVRSGSVWPSVLLHSLNNGILTGLALVRESLSDVPSLGNWVAVVLVCCAVATGLGVWLLSGGRRPSNVSAVTFQAGLLLLGLCFAAGRPQLGVAEEPADNRLPQVAEGWTIRKFAADHLAHDIHCLALGPADEVFVAGPGYVSQLLDLDGDGVADQAWSLPFQPREGPQGLWVERDWVWVVADGGIWQVERRSEGTVRKFLALPKTGGEHHFHAIRRGRDGHWYFLAGNDALIDQSFITRGAPIPRPRAGVLGRISPSGELRQVLVHGMRNAYGFAFALDQSFLLYDSDDERDTGLPWYRPTTLFAAREGDDVGWVSRCFKQPADSLGSPARLAETGRGSPTGVACQTSASWGTTYFGGVAFADWTFGRVYLQAHDPAAHLNIGQASSAGEENSVTTVSDGSTPLILVHSRPGVPLAPTSLEFDRGGNLYLATGGRNTQGAVYIVSRSVTEMDNARPQPPLQKLEIWFRQPAPSTDQPDPRVKESWAFLVDRDHELEAILHELAAAGVEANRVAAWRFAGRRLLLRDAVMHWGERAVSVADQGAWLRQVTAWEPQLAGDVLTWFALAGDHGHSTATNVPEFAPPGWRPGLNAWASLSEQQLHRLQTEAAAAARPHAHATATWTFAALAQQNAPPRLTAERWQGLSDRFVADLQRHQAGQPPMLRWADWLLIWRWALQSPVPHDGNTGPWDYLMRQESLPGQLPDQLRAALQQTWQTFPTTPPAAGESPRESWRHLLEIQQLLDVDRPTVAARWLQWFMVANTQRQVSTSSQERQRGWHPVTRLQAMVLLAAAEKPWPPECDPLVVDFLLQLDRQMLRWEIRSDRNWLSRTDDIGRLLCLGHADLAQQLADADDWSRPGQIPRLRLLEPRQQVQAVQGMSLVWEQWPVWEMDAATLDQLRDLTERWQLSLAGSDPAASLANRVQRQIAQWQGGQGQHLAARTDSGSHTTSVPTAAAIEAAVDWTAGNPARGKHLFAARQCATCHERNGRLGPALSGVTRRFARADILQLLLDPDTRITDRYRALWVQLLDGTLLTGRPVYESSDGLLLEDQTGRLWQLPRAEIEFSRPATKSLMPAGLMNEASPQDWADLWAYLTELP